MISSRLFYGVCPGILAGLLLSWAGQYPAEGGPPAAGPPIAGPPAAADGYLLRYRFTAGETIHYEVTHESQITMTKGAVRGVARNASTTRKHLRVVSVDEKGNALLEPVIDWVTMWVQFDDEPKRSYDSRSRSQPLPQFAGVAKTVGQPLVHLKVAPDGRLLAARPLLDKATQRRVAPAHGPPTAPNDAGKNFLVVFPAKPLRVGESWINSDLKVKLMVQRSPRLYRDYTILRKYTLVSVKDGRAVLSLSMAPRRPLNDPQLKVQVAQRMMSGTIVFDIKRGRIVSRKLVVDNTVFGLAQGQSRLHVKSERRERLLTAGEVAGREKDNVKK